MDTDNVSRVVRPFTDSWARRRRTQHRNDATPLSFTHLWAIGLTLCRATESHLRRREIMSFASSNILLRGLYYHVVDSVTYDKLSLYRHTPNYSSTFCLSFNRLLARP
ncbi:hypothetical protein EVAR_2655_1 [Eumeta japonica]|uniref:Uncharacterized protein n=1 Tax=Eumeta variegata TaxID=151549 RepID=A0A4C1SPH3_EUMVA|nr:hypothetical protein EVAR_2655_1 [Eumeta japonica]